MRAASTRWVLCRSISSGNRLRADFAQLPLLRLPWLRVGLLPKQPAVLLVLVLQLPYLQDVFLLQSPLQKAGCCCCMLADTPTLQARDQPREAQQLHPGLHVGAVHKQKHCFRLLFTAWDYLQTLEDWHVRRSATEQGAHLVQSV